MGSVIILILLGVLLFLIEFLLIPGITVFGIAGAVMTVAGVYIAFMKFGTLAGSLVLLFTLVSSVAIFSFSLRGKTWRKAMLKTNIDSNVAEELGLEKIKEGDQGETVGRLAPMGIIRVNGHTYEAKSIAGYLDPHTRIEIVKINGSQIIVKPLN